MNLNQSFDNNNAYIKDDTFLKRCTRVPQNSQEWKKLEYKLQLSLDSSTCKITNIWNINNPQNAQNFEKKNKDIMTLQTWAEIKEYGKVTDQQIEQICQKGYDQQQLQQKFRTGIIKINNGKIKKDTTYQCLLLKLAVGKSYCIPQKNKENILKQPPIGFNSVHFYNDDEEITYHQDYQIFDNSQVLPILLVHFKFDQTRENALLPKICDRCQIQPATKYCSGDNAHFCDFCAKEHDQQLSQFLKDKAKDKHILVDADKNNNLGGQCKIHPEQKLELFCTVCYTQLCVYCKIIGNHSTEEAASHQIVRLSDAYNKALADSNEFDPLLEKRKNQLTQLLNQIDANIKEINKNACQVEEEIYNIIQRSLQQLQEQTQKKLSSLICHLLEAKRQYLQIQWMESFLTYQQNVLQPGEYLNSWANHCQLKNDIINQIKLPQFNPDEIKPDLKLEGKIVVLIKSNVDDFDNSKDMNNLPNDGRRPLGDNINNNMLSPQNPYFESINNPSKIFRSPDQKLQQSQTQQNKIDPIDQLQPDPYKYSQNSSASGGKSSFCCMCYYTK